MVCQGVPRVRSGQPLETAKPGGLLSLGPSNGRTLVTSSPPVHLPLLTCPDHGRLWVGTQHALVVEFALVVHVVLKLPQGLRWLQQLPVFVVREMVLDEQGGVGEEVEFVVAGVEDDLVRSHVSGSS